EEPRGRRPQRGDPGKPQRGLRRDRSRARDHGAVEPPGRKNRTTQARRNPSNCCAIQRRKHRRSILAHLTHVTHSQMLETRRRRKRGKKDLAGAAKRAKKLAKWNAKKARAAAAKPA